MYQTCNFLFYEFGGRILSTATDFPYDQNIPRQYLESVKFFPAWLKNYFWGRYILTWGLLDLIRSAICNLQL